MFPREQAIDQHDLIAAAESNLFESFDDELSNAGYGETRRDFDFTEVPLPGQPSRGGQSHVIARPKAGVQQKVWGYEPRQQNWFEDVTVDSRGDMLDAHGHKVGQHAPQQGAPGHCLSCGCATLLPGGTTAAFCPSCGTPQQPMHQNQVGVQMGGGQAPQVVPVQVPPPPPQPGVVAPPPPGYSSMRMTGNGKPPPVVPEGLGKVDPKVENDAFAAFLDAAVEAGKEKTDEGPDPTQACDEPPAT